MAEDYLGQFASGAYRQAQSLQAQIEAQRVGQAKGLAELGRQVQETNERKAREQRERDDLQRELVQSQREIAELHRAAAQRQADRDAEDTQRNTDERRRRWREFGRWCFTTVVAVAGVGHAYGVDHWLAHVIKHVF